MSRLPVSTLLLTKNSINRLPKYFENMDWIDDIVMLDGFSTDGSKEFAAKFDNCQIHDQSKDYLNEESRIIDFGSMRNYGYTFAKHKWIICIDADEEVSPNFKESVQKILQENKPGVYHVAMMRRYKGKLTYTFRPISQLRLFHKDAVVGCIKKIHERIKPLSDAYHGTIDGYVISDVEDYTWEKNRKYINLELSTMRRLTIREWFRWIFMFNTKGMIAQVATPIINRLIPVRGQRMPLSQDILVLHYSWSILWKSFPLWRKIYPPDEATN